MMAAKILVVEDELAIQNVVRTYLENAGFQVFIANSGQEGLAAARQLAPDLVILDLMLPGMDGMEVAARLRQESEVYILMLSARSEEMDRVAGLRLGADDYLTKPFSPRELVARVEAILRRRRNGAAAQEEAAIHFPHLHISPDRMEAVAGDTLLDLTPTEFNLLLTLANNAGRVLTREQILDRVWGADFYGSDRIVDVYVGQVRRKLEDAAGKSLIQTVRGVGYKFVDEA
jgi:two-component system, OmpR family, alkaline phosphatase synthesis response regulator PhoP